MKNNIIRPSLIRRLYMYLQCLDEIDKGGDKTVSSEVIERYTGISANKFRKDITIFGKFGIRGFGYYVQDLKDQISGILNLKRARKVVLVGAGRMGTALATYPDWSRGRFDIVAVFDTDAEKIGSQLFGIEINHVKDMPKICQSHGVDMGIIAVPSRWAQYVANQLADAGVKSILNFAPTRVKEPKQTIVKNISLAEELATIACILSETEQNVLSNQFIDDFPSMDEWYSDNKVLSV